MSMDFRSYLQLVEAINAAAYLDDSDYDDYDNYDDYDGSDEEFPLFLDDSDDDENAGPAVEFPKDLDIHCPRFKETEKSYHDLLSLSLKLQRLVKVSKEYIIKEPEVAASPEYAETKLNNLVKDVKKIEIIARSKARKALKDVIGSLPYPVLNNVVDKMLLCDPRADMWKVESNSDEVKKEIEDVYMKLAKVYELLGKLCSCISVRCRLCGVYEKLEWDEEEWRMFIVANDATEEAAFEDDDGEEKK